MIRNQPCLLDESPAGVLGHKKGWGVRPEIVTLPRAMPGVPGDDTPTVEGSPGAGPPVCSLRDSKAARASRCGEGRAGSSFLMEILGVIGDNARLVAGGTILRSFLDENAAPDHSRGAGRAAAGCSRQSDLAAVDRGPKAPPTGPFLVKPYLQWGDWPDASRGRSMELVWHDADLAAEWAVQYNVQGKPAWQMAAEPVIRRIAVPGVDPHRVYSAGLTGLEPGCALPTAFARGASSCSPPRALCRAGRQALSLRGMNRPCPPTAGPSNTYVLGLQ